jgi:endonuclease YncB( thermonuclease family)
MHGIDAPESRTRNAEEKVRGLAAKQRLEELIANAETIVIKSLGVGKYGRCLGILFDADHEDPTKWKNINQRLITEGFATEYVK